MAEQPEELLVVLRPDQADVGLERLREAFRVTQVVPPRLAVVEPTAGGGEASLRALPGVEDVSGADVPDALMARLEPQEKLFVAAWSQRLTEAPKRSRPGEGLPWDAPGFEPPDHPSEEP